MYWEKKNRESSDPYYDLIEDFDLVVSSFQSQYGIRLSRELPAGMKWEEFRDLLVGIGPDTALGRIVSIRAEDRKEILENFTPEQHRVRNAWQYEACRICESTYIESAGGCTDAGNEDGIYGAWQALEVIKN